MTQWGREIRVDGVRPEWLTGPTHAWIKTCIWLDHTRDKMSDTPAEEWAWMHDEGDPNIIAIRLPADHPYYTATDAGFEYWPGGDSAPSDWDGGDVLYRDGVTGRTTGKVYWRKRDRVYSIIGYKRMAHCDKPDSETMRIEGSIYVQPRTEAEWNGIIMLHDGAMNWLRAAGLIVPMTDADHALEISMSYETDPVRKLIERGIAKGRELQKASK